MFVNGPVSLRSLEIPSVGVDERAAGEVATQHLIGLGHRRIGFVSGPSHYLPAREKAIGGRIALEGAGLNGENPTAPPR